MMAEKDRKQKSRDRHRAEVESLTDNYVKALIVSVEGIPRSRITPDMIDDKRRSVRLKRLSPKMPDEERKRRARESARIYRKKNPEKRLADAKKYYHANREKCKAAHKKWLSANREAELIKGRKYYQAHKKELVEAQKQYYRANRDRLREYSKNYRADNKGRIQERGRNWLKENPAYHKKWRREHSKDNSARLQRGRDGLHSWYMKQIVHQNAGIPTGSITDELVEAQREVLRAMRTVKKIREVC